MKSLTDIWESLTPAETFKVIVDVFGRDFPIQEVQRIMREPTMKELATYGPEFYKILSQQERKRGSMSMTRIHSLTVRIMGPDIGTYSSNKEFDDTNQAVVDDLRESDAISNIEDVINDELPDGFYCKIEE